MKFVLMLIAAACAGALTVVAVPTTFVSSGAQELRQIQLADLNPLRLIFDYEQQRIQAPLRPGQMGSHASPVVLKPISPPATLKLDLSQSLQTQENQDMQQNDRRLQDMQARMHDPEHWVGPPPN